MKRYERLAFIGFVILLLIFLSGFCLQAQDCVTGSGYVSVAASKLPCVDYRTETVDRGVPGVLIYRATRDSVIYRYEREGFNPHVIAHRRKPETVLECTFVYNGIIRELGHDPEK